MRPALILCLAAAGLVSACGVQGDLERPAPLFGEAARAEFAREQAAAEAGTPYVRPGEEDRQTPPELAPDYAPPAASDPSAGR